MPADVPGIRRMSPTSDEEFATRHSDAWIPGATLPGTGCPHWRTEFNFARNLPNSLSMPNTAPMKLATVLSAPGRPRLGVSALLAVGALVALCVAAGLPWIEFENGAIAVNGTALPMGVMWAVLLILAGLGISHAFAWYQLVAEQSPANRKGIVLATALGLVSLTGFWYGYRLDHALHPYEFRPGLVLSLYILAVVAITRIIGSRIMHRTGSLLYGISTADGRRLAVASALWVMAGSGSLSYIVLDGMPHMVDSFTYLMQGRMFWHGHLTLEAPLYPELWVHDRILEGNSTFGKYPLGWPAILGFFDLCDLAWLANPALAAIILVLTYWIVRRKVGSLVANLTALTLALTPEYYWHAATELSHLASTVWLLLFAALYQETLDTKSPAFGVLSGLALSGAIMTRPQDAAFFALPAVLAGAWLLFRGPKQWFRPLAAVVGGVIPGLALYLGINAYLMGNWAVSPYGKTPVRELQGHMALHGHGIFRDVLWLQESWVGLTREWFSGAFTASVPVAAGLWFGRRYIARLPILMACSLSFFITYGFAAFASRTWAGPRWYVPLIPVGAFIIASGVAAAMKTYRRRSAAGKLAGIYLVGALVAVLVTWLIAVPLRVFDLWTNPPHGTDDRVVTAVREAGLTNAVLGLEKDYLVPGTKTPNYKMMRSGYWQMRVPFEESDVIYVAKVPGWKQKAGESWPDRKLFEISEEPGVFDIIPVEPRDTN